MNIIRKISIAFRDWKGQTARMKARERRFIKAMGKVGDLMDKYEQFDLSFSLEYSSTIDWACDITPRKGHPQARQYWEVWFASGFTEVEAIERAVERAESGLADIIRGYS